MNHNHDAFAHQREPVLPWQMWAGLSLIIAFLAAQFLRSAL